MSLKQKASALGVLAAVAIGCLTAANASATSGGHFVITPETSHSIIFGTQTEKHRLEYALHGLEGGIICDSALYEGTAEAATVTQLDLKPTYSGCHTTGSSTNIPIDVNGCFYRLTVAKGSTDQSEQTVHLVCPFGKSIEITHPNCTVTIAPQNSVGGATYTTFIGFENTHKLTVDTTLQFAAEYHSGICVFTGTNHTATLAGSLTVNADTTASKTLNLTAT